MKNIFIISLKGFENSFLNSFKILVGILFGPLAWFVFIEPIRSSPSSGTVGERKIMFLVKNTVILVKKLLKWLEICLAWLLIDYQLGYWK